MLRHEKSLSNPSSAPALPGSAQQMTWPWQPAPNERVFTVVGGEE